jgi:hypothetical protein
MFSPDSAGLFSATLGVAFETSAYAWFFKMHAYAVIYMHMLIMGVKGSQGGTDEGQG